MPVTVPPIPTDTEDAIVRLVSRECPGVDPTKRLTRLAIRLAWAAGRGLTLHEKEKASG